MKFTPLQVAMSLSLLLHGGVATAVYVFHPPAATKTQLQLTRGHTLEVVICDEPATENKSVPLPAVAPAEVPPTPPVPEIKPVQPPPLPVLPPTKPEALTLAATVAVPVAPAAPRPVQPVVAQPAPAVSAPPAKNGDDVPANYLLNPKPVYPLVALRRREEGLVVLSVKVDRAGFPSQVQVTQSSKFELLDKAAVEAVRQWRFTPARIGTMAVASQIEVPVQFRLADY